MAGHSQFKNIMHRKGAQDAKRAKVFAKIAREIMVSAKSGLPDPAANPRLRGALASARAANMPRDNIDRALKKAIGGEDTTQYEEIRYEGYGPAGTAVIVEVLTDNRNRTAPEIRAAFSKYGGNLGESGSVSFMFDRVGLLQFSVSIGDFDAVFEAAVNAGAENVEMVDEFYEITVSIDNFGAARDALMEKFGDPLEAKIIWNPQNLIACDEEAARKVLKLIDVLEDNDDVQNVFSNCDISEELMSQLESV